ncbi:MAG: lysophospholipid acyltransferase family protein [Acidimicrobiia bacterium]
MRGARRPGSRRRPSCGTARTVPRARTQRSASRCGLVHSCHVSENDSTVPADIGALRDPAFLRAVRPVIELYTSYFRSEVRAFERLPPRGPFLVVGNHSGGQMPPDLPVLLAAWWRARGEDEPVYALFHSFFLALPGVGPTMKRAGAIEAGNAAAEAILRKGGIVIDFPGGDYDVFRPWRERNRIGFGDRLGFVRLALRTQVPVVPAVSVGAHETVIVLARGQRIARRLGLDRRFRIKVMPLVLGPPFGVVPGGIPTWPLPAKITVELCAPLDWSNRYGPEAAEDDVIVRACYDEITEVMQAALDRLAAERRHPILG